MADNIIKFPGDTSRAKAQKADAPTGFRQKLMDDFLNFDEQFIDDPLVKQSTAVFQKQFDKLVMMSGICGKISEFLSQNGFAPEDFTLDDRSVHLYLSCDVTGEVEDPSNMTVDMDHLWNGPRFVSEMADGSILWAVSSVVADEECVGGCTLDLLMLEPGSERWHIYNEGVWVEGPEKGFVDMIDLHRSMSNVIKHEPDGEDDDWLDEDEIDPDDEDSLYELGLSDRIIDALEAEDILTVSDLTDLNSREVLGIRGIGRASLEEIEELLDLAGFSLTED